MMHVNQTSQTAEREDVMRARIAAQAAAGLALTAALAAWPWGAALANGGPIHGGTLYVATQTDVPSLDPAVGVDTESIQFVDNIYAQLVTYNPTNLHIVPDLASSWSVSPNGKTYTFDLRAARFSNGDPVTAEDVKFTIERVLNPKTGASLMAPFLDIVGAQAYNKNPQAAGSVSGIQVLNSHTVRFNLVNPEPYFLQALASGTGSILDPAVVDKYGSAHVSQHPVGAGPYMLQSWKPGQQLVLVRNPYYFRKGLPYLNKIVLKIGLSPSSQLLAFEDGKLDIIGGALSDNLQIGQQNYLATLNSPTLRRDYLQNSALEIYSIYFNVTKAPFTNAAVRHALTYAIDREQLLRIVNGLASPANQELPPGLLGYDPHMPAIPYNPGLAKRLLAKAHAHGLSFTLVTMNDPTSIDVAQALQAMLKKVGVSMAIRPEALATYLNTILAGNDQASYGLWLDDYPDPEDFLFNQFYGHNPGGFDVSFWNDPTVNQLIATADSSTNPSVRARDYLAADKIILQQAPAIPLFYGTMNALVQPDVHSPGTDRVEYFLHQVLPIQFQYLWKSGGRG
jgi:oligopeptide transport system substrate-binding protein